MLIGKIFFRRLLLAPSKKKAITENPAPPLFIHKALPIFTDSRALNIECLIWGAKIQNIYQKQELLHQCCTKKKEDCRIYLIISNLQNSLSSR